MSVKRLQAGDERHTHEGHDAASRRARVMRQSLTRRRQEGYLEGSGEPARQP